MVRTGRKLSVLLCALALTGCAGAHPASSDKRSLASAVSEQAAADKRHAYRDWAASGGQRHLDILNADARRIALADYSHDLTALAAESSRLEGDIARARKFAGLPYPDTDNQWSQGLLAGSKAAGAFEQGIRESDPAQIVSGHRFMAAAVGHFKRISAVLKQVAG